MLTSTEAVLPEIGSVVYGKVITIVNYGAFVKLECGKMGMIHISDISYKFVKNISDFLSVNERVNVMVTDIDKDGRILLSLKHVRECTEKASENTAEIKERDSSPPEPFVRKKSSDSGSFEEMLGRFRQESDEKISDLKKSYDTKRPVSSYNRKNRQKDK